MGKGARNREDHIEELTNSVNNGSGKKKSFKVVKTVLVSLVGVAVVGVVAWGIGLSTGVLQKNLTAVSVGDEKINAVEFRYHYTDTKNQLLNNFGSAMQENGTDLSKPLEPQMYGEQTWAEYLKEATVSQIKETYSVYNEAKKANYVISEDIQAMIETYMKSIDDAAAAENITADKLVKNVYGKLMTTDLIREYITKRYYAVGYIQDMEKSFSPSDEEITKHYEDNKNDFDLVSYRMFKVPFEKVEGDDSTTTANKEASKAKADEMLSKITTEDSFGDLAYEYAADDKKGYYEDRSVTFVQEAPIVEDSGAIAEWYSDPERKDGDKAVIEGNTDYAVVMFKSRVRPEYNSVSVRHILIMPETADTHVHEGDTVHDDAEFLADAKAKADEVYSAYLAGDKTEDAFAALANEHSQDPGSNTTGGIYEEFGKNEMYESFDTWSFNPTNKPGDTGIIESESGFHIMYFVGEGRPNWMVQANNAMKTASVDKIISDAGSSYIPRTNDIAMSMAY